ncbi:MAG: 50S ribosomal protein L25/general stress protein Ctc [Prevotellaceae bacterium]|jgi:large subunit ribosomal protein L25|nr:50S ribosomal protein L25/general stress protein Ctc [Prevotellaceae bacterium]
MKTIDVKGTARKDLKKSAVKALRRNEQVPCVIYGNGSKNIHFTVDEKELKNLVYTPNAYLVNLDIDGKVSHAVMRELQFHPVTDKILHIDFYAVDAAKPIAIDVPVTISGNSEGVRAGGKLHILNRKVKVSALPKDLPDALPIDITDLALGKTVTAGDLSFDKVNIITPKTTIICTVKLTRAVVAPAEAAATATPEAAAAAAPAPAAEEKKK